METPVLSSVPAARRSVRRVWRMAVLTFCGIAGAYLLGFAYILWRGDEVVFAPIPPSYRAEECSYLQTPSGERIAFRYNRQPAATYVLLYSHGSSSDIGVIEPLAAAHARLGFSVLTYDYPGFGHSSGSLSEAGCYDAVETAYRHLVEKEGVSPSKIIAYGRSIGTGPALFLGANHPVAAVVLVSPFTEALDVDVWTRIFPVSKFDNRARIAAPDMPPVLILHGVEDANIPVANARAIFSLAKPTAKMVEVPGAGHEDIQNAPLYWQALAGFVRSLPVKE